MAVKIAVRISSPDELPCWFWCDLFALLLRPVHLAPMVMTSAQRLRRLARADAARDHRDREMARSGEGGASEIGAISLSAVIADPAISIRRREGVRKSGLIANSRPAPDATRRDYPIEGKAARR
jgi:hypothetical protein